YIFKDRLWFYGAYNPTLRHTTATILRPLTTPGSPSVGAAIPSDTTAQSYSGKLTWKVANNHTLWASATGDPSNRNGYIFSVQGPPSTWQGTLKQNTGVPNWTTHYDGVIGKNTLVRGVIGQDREKNAYTGSGANTAQLLDNTVNPVVATG